MIWSAAVRKTGRGRREAPRRRRLRWPFLFCFPSARGEPDGLDDPLARQSCLLARLLDLFACAGVEQAEHELVAGQVERAAEARVRRALSACGVIGRESELLLGYAGPEALRRVEHGRKHPACRSQTALKLLPAACQRPSPDRDLTGWDESFACGIPYPRPAHGSRARRVRARRRSEAARPARAPAAQREPRRLARAADRRAVRRPERKLRRARAAQSRLSAAQAAQPEVGRRASPARAPARLPAPGRAGRTRPRALRAARG